MPRTRTHRAEVQPLHLQVAAVLVHEVVDDDRAVAALDAEIPAEADGAVDVEVEELHLESSPG